jgi:hypothetical protein
MHRSDRKRGLKSGKTHAVFQRIPFIFNKLKHSPSNSESGFGLLLALAFVGFLSGLVLLAAENERYRVAEARAESASLHMVQIARAARILVRNNSNPLAGGVDINGDTIPDDAYQVAVVSAAAPTTIPLAQLTAAGLLPTTFRDTNVFGQTVRVYAESWPINDPAGVSAAFVVLEPSPKARQSDMQLVALSARDMETNFDAPLFDNGGNNISDACNGLPAVARWGGGTDECLNGNDVTAMRGAAFTEGELIIPAWLSSVHDPRAVMRYPQPNNPLAQTMATNIYFGAPDGGFAQIYEPDGAGGVNAIPTTIETVQADDSGAIDPNDPTTSDMRTNIIGINQIDVRQMIIQAQTPVGSEVTTDPALPPGAQVVAGNDASNIAGTTEVLNVSGGNIDLTGSAFFTGRMINPTANARVNVAGGGLNVDHSINLSDPTADMNIGGSTDVQDIQTDTLNVANNAAVTDAFGSTNITMQNTLVDGPQGVVMPTISMNGGLNTDNLDVLNEMTVNMPVTVNGDVGGGFAVAAEQVESSSITTQNLLAERGVVSNGNTTLSGTGGNGVVINQCASNTGQCPDIQELPPPCVVFGTCP